MIKFFCDICGREMHPSEASQKLFAKHGRLTVDLLTAVDGIWGMGTVCKKCIVRAIAEGEVYRSRKPGG